MKFLKAIVVSCQNDTVTMPNVKTTPLKCRLIKYCAANKYSAHENSKTVYICKYIYIYIYTCMYVTIIIKDTVMIIKEKGYQLESGGHGRDSRTCN